MFYAIMLINAPNVMQTDWLVKLYGLYRCAHTHQDPLTIGYHGICIGI